MTESPEHSRPELGGSSAGVRLPPLLRNPISLAGMALAVVSLANIFFFSLIDFIAAKPSPYVGILAYIVAPGFLILALFITGAGAWRARSRKKAGASADLQYPRIDLNEPGNRGMLISFGSFLLVFLMLSSVGSYKAYEFTDSVQFCGQTCHTVMHPEFTAHQLSPHARVACVDCHVGSGAGWYVKSKLSGARQLFAAAFNTFPRPIPTPVHNLRPAQDTCEQCHWPKKFYAAQLKVFTHYSSNEKNTPNETRMLIKTGGGDPATGAPEGIHWHMNIGNQIDYVATDAQRQTIAYVHVKDLQGRVTEYYAQDSKLSKEDLRNAGKHRMDCVDCHNRPTHIYVPPDRSVDESLLSHRLDVSLPYLKQQSVAVLTGKYDTTDTATAAIAKNISSFYESKYPEVARSKQLEIRNAVGELQRIYRSTIFPEMKVDWRTHPTNVGHLYFNGCFRCHDGLHTSAEGKVIPKDCDTCHTVLEQTQTVATNPAHKVLFQHPVDIGDLTQVSCSDCHTGGVGP